MRCGTSYLPAFMKESIYQSINRDMTKQYYKRNNLSSYLSCQGLSKPLLESIREESLQTV
jgi:hypothetical protein